MNVWILTDAERILKKPEQLLDEDDADSMIKIRAVEPPPPPIRTVHFHSDAKINARMVKKSLKDYEIESCEMMDDSKTDIIVTFKDAAGKIYRTKSSFVFIVLNNLWGMHLAWITDFVTDVAQKKFWSDALLIPLMVLLGL